MNPLETLRVHCPYCGEGIELEVDCSVPSQRYIEDCPVCCRPLDVQAQADPDGQPGLIVRRQDEA